MQRDQRFGMNFAANFSAFQYNVVGDDLFGPRQMGKRAIAKRLPGTERLGEPGRHAYAIRVPHL